MEMVAHGETTAFEASKMKVLREIHEGNPLDHKEHVFGRIVGHDVAVCRAIL